MAVGLKIPGLRDLGLNVWVSDGYGLKSGFGPQH